MAAMLDSLLAGCQGFQWLLSTLDYLLILEPGNVLPGVAQDPSEDLLGVLTELWGFPPYRTGGLA